jgi:hypothetical protein
LGSFFSASSSSLKSMHACARKHVSRRAEGEGPT